jgi:signal transduction histidine kinase
MPPRRTLRRWVAIGCSVALALALVAIVAGAFGLSQLTDARERLADNLDPAVTAAQQLTIAYVDQETGVRGYALGGEEEYLDPYEQGVAAAEAATNEINRLIGGLYPAVLPTVDAVAAAGDAWRSGYAGPTIAAVGTGVPAPLAPEIGRALFDPVRTQLAGLNQQLETLRADLRRQLDQAARSLEQIFIGVAVLLVAGVIVLTLSLRRGVLRPVNALAEQARSVADGDFQQRVRVDGVAEFAELSADVDAMRQRILAELTAVQAAHELVSTQAVDLRRSNTELEQFAYVASHDLQEPLRKVASFCQLLDDRYRDVLDERGRQYIDFAVDGATRMQNLINDLLAFSRVDRIRSESGPVAGDDMLRVALAGLAAAIDETDTTVDAEPLPALHGDASLLTTAVQNLIGNAIKFRRPDVPPRVRLRVVDEGDHWLFTCSDNGIGIEPQYAERIFTIFQRLHPRSAYPGTGIGLAMCRKIIEYHGGRLWLDPDQTRTEGTDPGSTFRFTLPKEPADPELDSDLVATLAVAAVTR